MVTISRKTMHSLAITGALALTAFAGTSVTTAGDAEARGFHRRGGGRMMHGGHFGGRHAFHHRHWGHRRHWGYGAPLVVGGLGIAAYGSECYIARQRAWSDEFGGYVIRRARICN